MAFSYLVRRLRGPPLSPGAEPGDVFGPLKVDGGLGGFTALLFVVFLYKFFFLSSCGTIKNQIFMSSSKNNEIQKLLTVKEKLTEKKN